MSVAITFWGTRGSIPSPGEHTQRYGGNTSCVSLEVGGELFICDGGTGLRELGLALVANKISQVEAHLLLSHTHWDHIQGFPFFEPIYEKGTHLYIWEVPGAGSRFQRLLLGQMRPDYFPVSAEELAARFTSRQLANSETKIGAVTLRHHQQWHPGHSYGYALEVEGQRFVYATDNELDQVLLNPEVVEADPEAQRLVPPTFSRFIAEADLLIADAQYTDEEYEDKRGYGHTRLGTLVDAAVAAGVRQLALFHHDPLHADEKIDAMLESARTRAALRGSALRIFAAKDGLKLTLG